jgi:hypothetical protein
MCAVTIERFIGIVYPLRSKFLREKKHVTQITLFVWIFSLICASPNLIYLRVITFPSSRRSCLLQYSKRSFEENQRGYIIHKSIESTIFYFIPLFIQLYCYIRIAYQLFHVDQALHTSYLLTNRSNNQRTQVFLFTKKKMKVCIWFFFCRVILMMKMIISIMMKIWVVK